MRKILFIVSLILFVFQASFAQEISFAKYFLAFKSDEVGYNHIQDMIEIRSDSTFSMTTDYILKKGSFSELIASENFAGTWVSSEGLLTLKFTGQTQDKRFDVTNKRLVFVPYKSSITKPYVMKYVYGADFFREELECNFR